MSRSWRAKPPRQDHLSLPLHIYIHIQIYLDIKTIFLYIYIYIYKFNIHIHIYMHVYKLAKLPRQDHLDVGRQHHRGGPTNY